MKHEHYEMIMAKAANMNLIVFVKRRGANQWIELVVHDQCLSFNEIHEYFLCLPQHKGACLHWLNGGKILFKSTNGVERESYNSRVSWSLSHAFMCEDESSRIKPHKETRWIVIADSLQIEDGTLYTSYQEAEEKSPGYKQIVPVEVEVTPNDT